MAIKVKMKKCKAQGCNNEFTPSFSTLQKYCSASCAYTEKRRADAQKPIQKKKPIKKVSDRRKIEQPVYKAKRLKFLKENPLCAIKGTNCTCKATTIEHTKGRRGFADDYARQNNISLYLDERFWLPACAPCNLELENNPELSQNHQLSKLHNGKKLQKAGVTRQHNNNSNSN